ncbi:MAG: hypothetical protein ABW049_07475 [Spongiibacteraceae bacterium]
MNDTAMKSQDISPGTQEPMAVGRYCDRNGEQQLLPYSHPEFERAILMYQFRLGTFHFRTGDEVLITSLFNESAQFAPMERSLRDFGLVLLSADSSFFDAARIESILRRFNVAAVAGINAGVLDGLIELGHDPLKLFANRVVWARPDAHARLAAVPGINLRAWLEVGPAVAMQCALGEGAHINRLEWQVDTVAGEIVLTSRLHRAVNFERYHTGVHAHLECAACACGSADPRVMLSGART